MSILANTLTVANTSVQVLSVPSGSRTTFNVNAVNTGASASVISLFAASREAVRVTAINVTDGGASYVAIPDITIAGGAGTGATAVAHMTADSATLATPGTGYTVGDELTVALDGQTGATITVTDVDGSGVIQAASLATGGDYDTLPASPAAVTGGTGTGAEFTLTYAVLSATLTEGGSGFTEAPAVTFSTGAAGGTTEIGVVVEAKHTIEHEVSLDAGGVLYRTALVLGPGDKLYALADSNDVAVTAWGVNALA